MKFTYNWLKDFLDLKLKADRLAQRLTMVGLEVTSLEQRNHDWVYEIEVTPNRPDLLSVAGIAREVAAITNSKLKIKKSKPPLPKEKRGLGLSINIEDKGDCPLYSAKVIKGLKVKDSPDWLKQRLELVGLRSVNNIVDATNYIQLSLGQPLHAFDLARIGGNRLIVRRARKGERIRTIDEQEVALDNDILIIADEKKPIALAGIMGGKETQVNHDTVEVLLESAKFNPLLIRQGRRKLGLASESSYRFERNIDSNNVVSASDCALNMIIELSQGEFIEERVKGAPARRGEKLTLTFSNLNKILGVSLKPVEVKNILRALGFKIKYLSAQGLSLEVPAYRQDIGQEADLIEEVARVWGYDRLPQTLPAVIPKIERQTRRDLLNNVRRWLVSQGACEIITYSLISRDNLQRLGLIPDEALQIVNPLSQELQVLRPDFIASHLIATSRNVNNQESVILFEIANIFSAAGERLCLGIILCGQRQVQTDSGRAKLTLNLFNLKGIIEVLFDKLGIQGLDWQPANRPYFDPGQAANLFIGRQEIGLLGKIKGEISERFDIKNKSVFAAQLYLDNIFPQVRWDRKFKALALYPSVRRDISLLVDEDIQTLDLLNFLRQAPFALLREVKIVDHYRGRQIPRGHKSLTISCDYQSSQRTLTDQEVNDIHAKLCSLLSEKFPIEIR